jgi:hypothetical protein
MIVKLQLLKVNSMIEIDDNEITRINTFLASLSTNLSSIDYVVKNNVFYPNKKLPADYNLMSYVLKSYPNTNEIILVHSKNSGKINLFARENGRKNNLLDLSISHEDNYTTATNEEITFSTDFLKDYLSTITSQTKKNCGGLEIAYIPDCGLYRINSATLASNAVFRLMKLTPDNIYNQSTVHWLNIDENPIYKIDFELADGLIVESPHFKLPEEVEDDIYYYINETNKLFSTLGKEGSYYTNNAYYKNNQLSIGLEYDKFENINVNVYGDYDTFFMMWGCKKYFLDYIKENCHIFYNPIFKDLIETVTNTKLDTSHEKFKDPECLKMYLTTLEMIKV